MASDLTDVQVGDRRSYDGAACTIRFVGTVTGTSGTWLGVEWDDPARGKHDGSHKGERYFSCTSHSPTAASFVRPTRPFEQPRGFLRSLVEKYTAELADVAVIKFSGKIAEEVGFDKTRRQQANLAELRVAILDGERVSAAYDVTDVDEKSLIKGAGSTIAQTCPKVRDLDLSRNLFSRVGAVIDICSELPALRTLRLNGNRFDGVIQDASLAQDDCRVAIQGLEELALEDTLMTWDEICHLCARCEKLVSLSASTNQLTHLPLTAPLLLPSSLTTNLMALTLEFNEFTCIADISSLGTLKALRNLHLKGNNIRTILAPQPSATEDENPDPNSDLNPTQYTSSLPVFSPSVQYLDVSYNAIDSWDFIDSLPTCFPGLTALRFAHNPVYDNPDPDHSSAATTKNITEEAYMFTVARLPGLKALNFGTISKEDRQDAEMFYLGRIGKHLSSIAVPVHPPIPSATAGIDTAAAAATATEKATAKLIQNLEAAFVKRHHPRYAELCDLYGAPAVVRRHEINPAFIEARLITIHLSYSPPSTPTITATATADAATHPTVKTVQIPKSLDVYAVKGIVARILGLSGTSTGTSIGRKRPLDLRLVWETGEWDPVADFDQRVDEDSSDEEDEGEDKDNSADEERSGRVAGPEGVRVAGEPHQDMGGEGFAAADGRVGGKWIKREVELLDGPRQLGFCVDGQEVRIRVELR